MGRVATYLSFIRFSHSVFALPFALTGALLAWQRSPFDWRQILWVIVAMVSARSAAMGFQPPGRRAHGRAQSAHRDARDSARRPQQSATPLSS
jgi:hypothetical protein